MNDWPAQLAARLAEPLPGRRAFRRFEPELSYGRQAGPPAPDARRAAVVILFYPQAGQWRFPLILRPDHMPTHAGQFGLPGGMLEYGESTGDAALRELDEELGLAEGVELLGKLSEIYVFVSNCRLTPWVAWTPQLPAWKPNPSEVAQILEVPLADLVSLEKRGSLLIERRRLRFTAPCFHFGGHCVWGATSMILGELSEVVSEASD